MHRLDGLQISKTVLGAPAGKAAGCACIGPARVGVADLGGEEFDRAFGCSGVGREEGWQGSERSGLDLGDELGHFGALYHE